MRGSGSPRMALLHSSAATMGLQGVLFIALIVLRGSLVEGSHYKGGSISIEVLPSSVPPNSVLNITTAHAIDTSCSDRTFSHQIRSLSPFSSIGSTDILTTCSRYDPVADASFFRGSDTFTISESDGLVEVSYTGCCWADEFNSENWKIFAQLDVSSVRADTGNYNSNPVTTVPLKLTLIPGCQAYQIPITDADGDRFKCRIANDTDDCADLCVYNNERPGNLSEDCLLDFTAGGSPPGGPYLVNLIVEDFLAGSDIPLSYIFSQFVLEFSTSFPGTILPSSFGPFNETLVTGADNVFTLYFDEMLVAPAQAAAVYFVDIYTQEVFHTIVINTPLGRLQLKYPGTSVEIRPFIDFNEGRYQGRTLCILADAGYAASDSCVDQTAALDDPTLWCFSIPRDECKYGALVNCTTYVSPEYCDLLYDPTWGPCGPYTSCADTADSYLCSCLDGYEPDPALTAGCTEIDECTNGSYVNCTGPPSVTDCSVVFDPVWGPCGRNTSCTNLPGAYRCDCLTGYIPDPADPLGCIALCGHPDVDPHASLMFQDNLLVQWLNEGDIAKYECESGYHVSTSADSWSQECLVTGSWNVTYNCVDIDECAMTPDPCGEAFCLNLPGAYVCLCLVGQVYDVDTGTCKPFSSSCEFYNVFGYCANGGVCSLQNGKPRCRCPEGYDGPQCEIKAYTQSLTLVLAAVAFALGCILLLFLLIHCFQSRRVKIAHTVRVAHPQPRVKHLPVPFRRPPFLRFPFLHRRNEPNYHYPLSSPTGSTQELRLAPHEPPAYFNWM